MELTGAKVTVFDRYECLAIHSSVSIIVTVRGGGAYLHTWLHFHLQMNANCSIHFQRSLIKVVFALDYN